MTDLEEALTALRGDAERQMNRIQAVYDPHELEWTITLGPWKECHSSLELAARAVVASVKAFRDNAKS